MNIVLTPFIMSAIVVKENRIFKFVQRDKQETCHHFFLGISVGRDYFFVKKEKERYDTT